MRAFSTSITMIVMAVLMAVGPTLSLAETTTDSTLEQKVQRLEKLVKSQARQIQQLQDQAGQNWLNEQRAEEVRELVKEVLADADTRASLLENSLSAGHANGHFYLASEDGSFLLNLSGYMQVRYIFNTRNGNRTTPTTTVTGASPSAGLGTTVFDRNESGFEIARAKLIFAGHIFSPKLQYSLGLRTDTHTGEVLLDHAVFCYDLANNLKLWAGETKAAVLREESIEATHQLAVDRSLANELFSVGYVQGIGLLWTATENLTFQGALHDGARSGESGGNTPGGAAAKSFYADSTDFALSFRVDYKVWGDWEQAKDFSAWSGESKALFIGAAFNWDNAERGSTGPLAGATALHDLVNSIFTWTVDAQFEMGGLNLFAAFISQQIDTTLANAPATYDGNLRNNAMIVQGGYFFVPDKLELFTRYELINLDGDLSGTAGTTGSDIDQLNIITMGGNYYFHRHNAKITLDTVLVLDPLDTKNIQNLLYNPDGVLRSLGLLNDANDKEMQVAFRAQFQLMF